MRAAIFTEHNGPMSVEDVTPADPGPRDVIVHITASGVCHSDLHVISGALPMPPPAILGHEGCGVVEAVGSEVTRVQLGDRVIGSFIPACGHCWFCLRDQSHLCANTYAVMGAPRATRGDGTPLMAMTGLGTFADMMTCDEMSLVKIDTDVPDEQLALIGCGVTTGVGAALNTANVKAGDTVAVIGCGGVGLNVIQGARIAGAGRIIAIDLQPAKLELARQFGATDTVDASKGDPVAQARELAGGGVHYAFEAIGLKQTAEQAFGMLRAGGTCTVIGMIPLGQSVEIPGYELLSEKKLIGSNMGSNRSRVDMPRYIDLYLDGRLKLDELVSRRIGLDEVNAGFDAMKAGEVCRSVILFE